MTYSVVKLKDICDYVRGLTYSKNDEVEFSKNAVLRATNIDLSSNKLNLSELRYIDDSVQVRGDKKVKVNDILMCTASGSKSHLGKVALIEEDLDMAFGGFMGVLRVKSNTNAKYLFNFLKSDLFLNHVFNLGDGANINNLKFSQIEDLELSLPPIKIQEQVVKRLDAVFIEIDKAFKATESNVKNSEALFQSYLDKLFDEDLAKFEKIYIKDVCQIGDGNHSSKYPKKEEMVDSGIPFIRSTNIVEGKLSNKELVYLTETKHLELKKGHLKTGDVLITNRGEIGKVAIVEEEFNNSNLNSQIAWLRCKSNILNEYLLFFLMSAKMKSFYSDTKTGAALQQLPIGKIERITIPLPDIEHQRNRCIKFKYIQNQAVISKVSYKDKVKQLSLLKESILQQAFNGGLIKE